MANNIDMKFIRSALLKSAGITNKFIAENCVNPKTQKKGINISQINREINGIGFKTDYVRKFIWKLFSEKSKVKVSYKTFWGDTFKI